MAKAAKKIAVKSKQSTKPKPRAKAAAKPVSRPATKATGKKGTKPVTKAAAAKPAKKATKPVAQKSALARKPVASAVKPKTAPTKKPTTSVVKAVAKSKVADERGSALEPKPGTVARKPTTTVTKKKPTGRSGKDVETDRYEAARPGTAIIARSQARPVQTQGVDGSKSPFDSKELKTWRAILMQKRAELTDDIADLRKDAMDSEDGHTTPNHIAERGSDADLQDLNLGVADQEEMLLHQIDRALRKIELGRPIAYGLCEHTSQPIPTNRLELMPWTPISIQGAEHMEQNGLSIEDVLIED